MSKTISALALLVAASVYAQTPAATPQPASSPTASAPAPALPKPAPELQRLAFLVGDWIHEETYQASPFGPAGPGKGRSKISWLLGDHHLNLIYATNTPMGKLEARGFLGYDVDAKVYRMSWFDNVGMATHYTGHASDDGSLTFTTEYTYQGQKVKEQIVVAKSAGGKVSFTAKVVGPDGSLQTTMESVATPTTPK